MSLYHNFADTLSILLEANLSSIQTGHNFEYGPELEIILCETLESVLPDNYGIARGFLTTKASEIVGDDIIIYERSRFPTLALRKRNNFARKEFIPIEAAYCYIEAKHTVVLTGNGPASLKRACEQVAAAKKLMRSREPRTLKQIGPNLSFGTNLHIEAPAEFPDILNPPYGMIFARQVKIDSKGDIVSDPLQIDDAIQGFAFPDVEIPDLISLGPSNVCVPALVNDTKGLVLRSPFYIEDKSQLVTRVVENKRASAVALVSLMAALDWIELGKLPWHEITVDAIGIPYE